MKTNELIDESDGHTTPVWNKENYPSYNNAQLRKKHLKTLAQQRPATPLFETTFNPYPQHNGFSIPLIPSKRPPLASLASLNDSNDIREGLAKLSLKQKPIIAKSHKLKDFFTHQSARYLEGESRQRASSHRLRGKSLNALSIRRESLQTLPDPHHKISKQAPTRKQEFERLYLKQREAYQRILIQHGVMETITDEEFHRFMGCD